MATIIRLNQSITNNNAPRLRKAITSDDFSGTGELVGSMTSAALGGTPMQWGGNPGWTRHNGGIHTPQGSSAQVLELNGLPADLAVSYRAVTLPDSGYIALSVRMQDSYNRVVFCLGTGGSVWIQNRIDGGIEQSSTANGVKAGDILTFAADGDHLTASINGLPVLSYTAQILEAGTMRLSTSPVINAVIDDLVIAK